MCTIDVVRLWRHLFAEGRLACATLLEFIGIQFISIFLKLAQFMIGEKSRNTHCKIALGMRMRHGHKQRWPSPLNDKTLLLHLVNSLCRSLYKTPTAAIKRGVSADKSATDKIEPTRVHSGRTTNFKL